MTDSPETQQRSAGGIASESNLSLSPQGNVVEVHPMAFTIEFNDQKFDEAKKSRVHERLSALSLKHKRNPSLPEFGSVKNDKSNFIVVKPSTLPMSQVACDNKGFPKLMQAEDTRWRAFAGKFEVNSSESKSPVVPRKCLEINGGRKDLSKNINGGRRHSLNNLDEGKVSRQDVALANVEYNVIKTGSLENNEDVENKSDTVSEAGTYTLDKENEIIIDNDLDKTHVIGESENGNTYLSSDKNFQSDWINDWVRDVEEQNMLNLAHKEQISIVAKSSANRNGCPTASKIPSPIHTINRRAKVKSGKFEDGKQVLTKLSGCEFYKCSSSLSAKDYNENQGSESSLETESFLRTTESVVTAMQSRMRLSLDGRNADLRKNDKRDLKYRERPHPPSTASDTDTNSETDVKNFKKPLGNPFTSARLNRAFSLRRAKADPEKDSVKRKELGTCVTNPKNCLNNQRLCPSPKTVVSKPPSTTAFSRTDCGRFSMRSTTSALKANMNGQVQKKEVKKSTTTNRSTSSLTSREVEFQNWRRRKSFDPMKAAAEGRKKEMAKKAAMSQSMSQSVNLGTSARNHSGGGNPVSRSASFHSAVQAVGHEDGRRKLFESENFSDRRADSPSWISERPLPHNSPALSLEKFAVMSRGPVFNSRTSLISETHSSPSRRGKSDDLDNLVLSAISDLSQKLKLRSLDLLKRLQYLHGANEEKSFKLKDEITVLESRQDSTNNSPIHRAASRDLSTILKNLKGLEKVFKILDDVLFDENLEIYLDK